MSELSMKITIAYKFNHSNSWEYMSLHPDEYFDLEPEEKFTLDSVPKYNHAIEYLNIDITEINATKLSIIDENTENKCLIIEKFWHGGKNRLIERHDFGDSPYWEMILEQELTENPAVWEVMRLGKEDEVIVLLYHGFLQDNDDGSQTEIRLDNNTNSGQIISVNSLFMSPLLSV
jgi:hypothetical protein